MLESAENVLMRERKKNKKRGLKLRLIKARKKFDVVDSQNVRYWNRLKQTVLVKSAGWTKIAVK